MRDTLPFLPGFGVLGVVFGASAAAVGTGAPADPWNAAAYAGAGALVPRRVLLAAGAGMAVVLAGAVVP